MEFFIKVFKKDVDRATVREIIAIYSQKELFEKMSELHCAEELFSVYSAECVLDFS